MTDVPSVRVLTVGYTTLAQARSKGIVSDHAESFNLWYNPGGLFTKSVIYVPFGKADLDLELTDRIRYIERSWRRGAGRLMTAASIARQLWRAVLEGRRLIATERIDVLKSNGPNVSAATVLVLHYLSRKPAVLFIEAFWETLLPAQQYFPLWLRNWLPRWYRYVYRAFDFYFGTPSIDPEYFVSKGMSRDRILPWVNELDLELLKESAKEERIPPTVDRLPRPRIVTVGRLHTEKLAHDALDVLARLAAHGREASLTLVGDGEERRSIEAEAYRLGLQDRVLITGVVPQASGFSIVLSSDLYFAPMQGNALVEALYSEVPVVAYDHATHRNLIRDGETGHLVPFRDIDAVVAALEQLLDEPDRARTMASKAKSDMEARFGRAVVAETLSRPIFAAYAKAHSDRAMM